jgi:hypothetical protein
VSAIEKIFNQEESESGRQENRKHYGSNEIRDRRRMNPFAAFLL